MSLQYISSIITYSIFQIWVTIFKFLLIKKNERVNESLNKFPLIPNYHILQRIFSNSNHNFCAQKLRVSFKADNFQSN